MASASLSKLLYPRFPSILYLSTRFLMKVLEVSILAASLVGDAHLMPMCSRASTTPLERGASGPMNAYSTKLLMAKSQILSMSSSLASRTSLALLAMPGLLFFITAKISALARANASTAACSLAPPPTVRIFIPCPPQNPNASMISSTPFPFLALQVYMFLRPPVSLL